MLLDAPLMFPSEPFKDSRGMFLEMFGEDDPQFHQGNLLYTHRGAFRGLHMHNSGKQVKYGVCVTGLIQYVAVNVKTGNLFSHVLSMGDAIFIPPYHASGFAAVWDSYSVYFTNQLYEPENELVLSPKYLHDIDPKFRWEVLVKDSLVSEKDKNGGTLDEVGRAVRKEK